VNSNSSYASAMQQNASVGMFGSDDQAKYNHVKRTKHIGLSHFKSLTYIVHFIHQENLHPENLANFDKIGRISKEYRIKTSPK
jgi:hypothetical protein